MAVAYDKAMVYAQYRRAMHIPGTNARLVNYHGPEFPGSLDPGAPGVTLQLHWHPLARQSVAAEVGAKILAAYTITANDKVCVFGCGFDYLGSWLRDNIGCEVVGVDLSQYVQDYKDLSPNLELIEEIQAQGLDETVGNGLLLFNMFSVGALATYADTIIVQGDVKNVQVRNQIKQQLGNKNPTVVITDDVWQTLTPQEQADYQAALESWVNINTGGQVIHYINGVVI